MYPTFPSDRGGAGGTHDLLLRVLFNSLPIPLCKDPNDKWFLKRRAGKVSQNVLLCISLPPKGREVVHPPLFALTAGWAISITDAFYFHFMCKFTFYFTVNLFFTFNLMSYGLSLLYLFFYLKFPYIFFPANR